MNSNYTYLTKLYARWTVYIDECSPDSIRLKIVCSTYGDYEIRFLFSSLDFIPQEEGLLRLRRRVGEGFISTLRDICIYLHNTRSRT